MTTTTSVPKDIKVHAKAGPGISRSGRRPPITAPTVGFAGARTAKDASTAIKIARAIAKSPRYLFLETDQEYVERIRAGVPASYVVELARDLRFSRESFLHTLHFPASTIERKIQKSERLSSEQSERLLGVARLIGQVQEMVNQSGDPEGFDASQWLGQWLARPLPALGGERPRDYMDTIAGQQVVSKLLAQIQSGAYA